jgi:ADP-heptose:LPS heptosyltransferase
VLMPHAMTLVLPQPRTSGAAGPPQDQHERAMMMQLASAVVARFDPLRAVAAALERIVDAGADVHSLLPRDARRPLIVVNPFSGRTIKNWPERHYRTIIMWLANDLLATVVLVGSSEQCRDAAALMRRVGSPSVYDLVGQTRLDQAFALIDSADLFLGNDSGLAHASALLRRPTVALYSGIAPIAQWRPIGPHVTTLHTDLSCAPCGLRHLADCCHAHACMTAISVEAVQAAVQSALQATHAPRRIGSCEL